MKFVIVIFSLLISAAVFAGAGHDDPNQQEPKQKPYPYPKPSASAWPKPTAYPKPTATAFPSPTAIASPSPSASPFAGIINVSIPVGAADLGTAAYGVNPLVIPAGSVVVWRNNDDVIHTATSDTGLWDSGVINPGGTYARQFTTAGIYHLSLQRTRRGRDVGHHHRLLIVSP